MRMLVIGSWDCSFVYPGGISKLLFLCMFFVQKNKKKKRENRKKRKEKKTKKRNKKEFGFEHCVRTEVGSVGVWDYFHA